MTDNPDKVPLTQADGHLINILLELAASLQGLGFAVEVLAAAQKLSEKQSKPFDEGLKRFSENRDKALASIKRLVEPHLKK